MTTTVTVHDDDAGMVSPVNERLVWPAAKKLPPVPAQVPPAAPAAAIDMLASVSAKFAAVSAMACGLAIVKVRVEVPSAAMEAGAKALAIAGATAVTVSTAVLDAALGGASALVKAVPALLCAPGTMLVTTTVTVQLPLAGHRDAGEGESRLPGREQVARPRRRRCRRPRPWR